MSILGRRIPKRFVFLVALCLIVVTLIPVMTRTEVREIRLVARDMSFYLADDPRTANPTITVRAGESIRFVLQNDDRGFVHDFALPVSKASTDTLAWGKQGDVTVTAPATPGEYEYVCQPHRAMMRGRLNVIP